MIPPDPDTEVVKGESSGAEYLWARASQFTLITLRTFAYFICIPVPSLAAQRT